MKQHEDPYHVLLNRKEAADYLGVKENTLAVWESTKRYNLRMIKVGRLCKYRLSDLNAFLENSQA